MRVGNDDINIISDATLTRIKKHKYTQNTQLISGRNEMKKKKDMMNFTIDRILRKQK